MHEDQHALSYCCTFEDAVLGALVAGSDDSPMPAAWSLANATSVGVVFA